MTNMSTLCHQSNAISSNRGMDETFR